jgi:uncharacterized protein
MPRAGFEPAAYPLGGDRSIQLSYRGLGRIVDAWPLRSGRFRGCLHSIAVMEPDAVEIRVLGCLLEKQRTTPDAYPLSLNALRLACNQATNRDPVVDYEEPEVVEALRRTALRGWTRLASNAGSRARKYRHLLDDALDLDPAELSLLAVLMLRGPQTPGELKQRSERLHGFDDLSAVHDTLDRLVDRGHVVRHERRPGQKEDRYEQLLGGEGEVSASPPSRDDGVSTSSGDAGEERHPEARADVSVPPGTSSSDPASPGDAFSRLDRLEAEIADLRAQVTELREALGE